jgi:integrase
MKKFTEFCRQKQFNGLDTIVHDYRAARDSDNRRKLSQYTDAWNDVLQEYTIWLKHHHAPATVKNQLAILQSFFKTAKVPVEVDMPKRAYVTYPKQNLKRKAIQLIISRSTVRNRATWLMLAESGLRPYTVTQIRWWWIKEDYLAGRVPMMIRIPQQRALRQRKLATCRNVPASFFYSAVTLPAFRNSSSTLLNLSGLDIDAKVAFSTLHHFQ